MKKAWRWNNKPFKRASLYARSCATHSKSRPLSPCRIALLRVARFLLGRSRSPIYIQRYISNDIATACVVSFYPHRDRRTRNIAYGHNFRSPSWHLRNGRPFVPVF